MCFIQQTINLGPPCIIRDFEAKEESPKREIYVHKFENFPHKRTKSNNHKLVYDLHLRMKKRENGAHEEKVVKVSKS